MLIGGNEETESGVSGVLRKGLVVLRLRQADAAPCASAPASLLRLSEQPADHGFPRRRFPVAGPDEVDIRWAAQSGFEDDAPAGLWARSSVTKPPLARTMPCPAIAASMACEVCES